MEMDLILQNISCLQICFEKDAVSAETIFSKNFSLHVDTKSSLLDKGGKALRGIYKISLAHANPNIEGVSR
jgi:hypothetical protein